MEIERMMNRRALLRAMAGGLAAVSAVPLLAACGGDDDDDELAASTATATQPAAEPTATTAPATATSPPAATTSASTATAPAATATNTGMVGTSDRLMGKEIEQAANEGGTLIQGGPYGGETISPFDAYPYAYLVFETLAEIHPDTAEPVGDLAEAWEVSGDGRDWTFSLRDGVTWHDGEPFTADDVTVTYQINTHPDNVYASSFSAIASVETVDERTVAFTLNEPLVDFIPNVIAIWPIGPAHIWEGVEVAKLYEDPGVTGADASRVVGTGPFRFEELVTADHVTLARNEDYWDGTPYLDGYIFRLVPDPSAMSQQLRAGELDMDSFPPGVDPAAVAELEGADDVSLLTFPSGDVNLVHFNLDPEKTPLFQDVRVRRAMLHALDREALAEAVLFGYGEVAHGTITPISWAYVPDGITTTYDYDPDKAGQLLDEAGWTLGSDGVREKDGQKLAFTGLAWEVNVDAVSYAQAIQQYWKAAGIDMTVQVEQTDVYYERFADTFDYEVVVGRQFYGADPDRTQGYACDAYESGSNRMKYCNPELDELLGEARSTTDRDTRVELYVQVDNILAEDLPVLPLAYRTGLSAVNKRVHNVFPNALNSVFNAETWWVEE